MRFYLTEDSELVPFEGLPYLHEEVSAASNINKPMLEQLRAAAYRFIDHPNMLYLHPDCRGYFDRLDNNPYMLSIATFQDGDGVMRKIDAMTYIFRRLDLRAPDSGWMDYLRDRHHRLEPAILPTIRKALITEFLNENA